MLWGLAKWLVLVLVPLLLLLGFSAILDHGVSGDQADEYFPAWRGAAQIAFSLLALFFLNAVIKWLWRTLFPEKRKG